MGRIVVGVDGSDHSKEALRWAADEATLRGSSLEVVHTFEHEPSWASFGSEDALSAGAWERVREDISNAAERAREVAQTLVETIVRDLDVDDVRALAIESDHPAHTLVEHSKGAEMLVVGSRGRGGFQSLMLGSVSQQCAQHAECPVVILRRSANEIT